MRWHDRCLRRDRASVETGTSSPINESPEDLYNRSEKT
jgi:hypothetical protein